MRTKRIESDKPNQLPSPWQTFAILMAAVFIAEAFVMYLIHPFEDRVGHLFLVTLDASLLLILIAPLLWLFIVRPLRSTAIMEQARAATVIANAADAVVTIDGATDTTTMIVGFTITGGTGNVRTAEALAYRVGLGIEVAGGGATIRRNILTANNVVTSLRPGGVISIWDPADVNGVTFVVVDSNTIADNSLTGYQVEGGALALGHNCRIFRNRILRNSVTGTVLLGLGAAAQIWNGTITFDENLIRNNSASQWGGALQINQYQGRGPTVTLVNNIIANNSAGTQGGALWVSDVPSTILSINNTIIGNTSPNGSGLYMRDTASFKAINTILWNPGTSEITLSTGGTVTAAYSNIRGGLTGTGNINSDPLFSSTHPDSLGWFQYYSACRDAGAASATVGGTLLTAPTIDYYEHLRDGTPDIGAFEAGIWSSVEEVSGGIPADFILEQNYPNPFNPSTVIRFALPKEADVQIDIYNILGQKVEDLVNERLSAGFKQVTWTANVPSGVYLYRITVSAVGGQRYEQAKSMVFVR